MTGYYGFSKSNNAVDAEEDGRYPASVAAKMLGVTTAAIKAILPTYEWHHSSKYYNAVDYYDIHDLLAVQDGDLEDLDPEDVAELRETLARLKAYKPPKTERKTFTADVQYLLWGGTRSRPKSTAFSFKGIRVDQSGKKLTFHLPDGSTVVKMVGSNGTYLNNIIE